MQKALSSRKLKKFVICLIMLSALACVAGALGGKDLERENSRS